MKAVVGEDALSLDDKNFLIFLEHFEDEFLRQGKYECRDIFTSLDKAWDMLRIFEKNSLSKIDKKLIEQINGNIYYQFFCGIRLLPGQQIQQLQNRKPNPM